MAARAVYTALFGDYEALNDDQAVAADIDFVCFTDNPELRSDRWRIVVVEPEFPLDPHRSQRRIKIVGHPALKDFDETLYIDNAVSLLGGVHEFLDTLLGDSDMGMVQHSFRANLGEEFATVLREGLDDHHRLMEQWDHYAASYPEVLGRPVLWGGVIARRTTASVDALCTTWFDHVLRYSRRDQLSAPVAIALHPEVAFAMRTLDNYSSTWHTWPVALSRSTKMRDAAWTLRVPAELAALSANADRVHDLEQRLAGKSAEVDALAQAIAETHASRSWRVTAPLRRRGRRQ